jgi:hypothetical protein
VELRNQTNVRSVATRMPTDNTRYRVASVASLPARAFSKAPPMVMTFLKASNQFLRFQIGRSCHTSSGPPALAQSYAQRRALKNLAAIILTFE